MTIDIKPGKGKWWVIAYTDSGKAHDDFYTHADALAFALDFYGGTVVTVAELAETPTEGDDSMNLLLKEIAELDASFGGFLFDEVAA